MDRYMGTLCVDIIFIVSKSRMTVNQKMEMKKVWYPNDNVCRKLRTLEFLIIKNGCTHICLVGLVTSWEMYEADKNDSMLFSNTYWLA